jgi:uncharacterized protein
VDFLDLLGRSQLVRLGHISADLETRALGWLRRHDEREYSFADASSFALMKTQRIREVLAFDGDYASAGFVELRL